MPAAPWMKSARKTPAAPSAPAAPEKQSAPARNWRPHALAAAALCLIALAAYSNSFHTGFPFDNSWTILQDTRVQDASRHNIYLILTRDYWYQTTLSGLYRPLTTLSYLFNYAILGNRTHPEFYHVFNFALHAINAGLVYALGLLLLGEAPLAFALAAVWEVHPVLTESVTNIVGRADLLAAFGVLAGLLCHVRATGAAGARKAAWLAALTLASAIGMFSKESGVVLVAALVLYDIAFPNTARWRARIAGYVAAAAPVGLFFFVRSRVFASTPPPIFPFIDNPLVGADFLTSRLTAVKVIGKYLWLLLWPAHLSSDYSYNAVPLVGWRLGSLEDWKAYLALAACMAAAAAAWVCYRRSKPLFFFVAFFFVALAPTANIAILIGTVMAERFLYLAGRTWARNPDWQDDVTLWSSAVRSEPASYKTHMNVAGAWSGLKDSDPVAAIREVDKSLAILDSLPDDRNVAAAYSTAGMWYRMRGEKLPPGQARPWYEKSLAILLRGERIGRLSAEALAHRTVPRDAPLTAHGWPPLYLQLARTYMRLAQPAKAVEALEYGRLLSQKPEFSDELSKAWRAMGDNDRAAISLIEGATIDPGQTGFAAELADLYKETDPHGCAVVTAGGKTSVNMGCPKVRGQFCAAFRNVAILYIKTSQTPEANAVMQTALRDFGCPATTFR
jgi:tetratricopeptide (TPR) repeat protein